MKGRKSPEKSFVFPAWRRCVSAPSDWLMQPDVITGVTAAWREVLRALCALWSESQKRFCRLCAGWATAFKCMGRHIGVRGGLERDPEGRSVQWRKRPAMDSLNQSSLKSRRQVDLTDTAWMLGPLGDCFLPKESSFLPPCFYCCSCDVTWIFLSVYAQQDVLPLLRGSARRSSKLLLFLFSPSLLSEVWKTQRSIWIRVWFPLPCTCKYVMARHFYFIFCQWRIWYSKIMEVFFYVYFYVHVLLGIIFTAHE